MRGTPNVADADAEAVDALGGFKRFPAWMWRNADVLDFVGWLRTHNDALPAGAAKVGFYGLDLYSLHTSMEAVLGYLDKVDSPGAARARYRYGAVRRDGVALGDDVRSRKLWRLHLHRGQPLANGVLPFSGNVIRRATAGATTWLRFRICTHYTKTIHPQRPCQ